MKTLAALLGLTVFGSLTGAPLPRPYQVQGYQVRLVPDLAAKKMAGEVTIKFTSTIERLDAVELDAGDLQISSAKEGASARYFERKDKLLIVVLGSPAYRGDHRTLTIAYTATPAKGLVFFADQIYTSFFTSDWMPCDEQPEDRATLRLTLDTPEPWKVAASGHPDGRTWTLDTPMPAFLYAFAAGEFAESTSKAGGVTMRVLGKANVFDRTADAIRFLADKSGQAYPGETYTQVYTHGSVEQEAVGMTLLPEKYALNLERQPDDLWLLVHELAHQWYGIGITTRDWSDFWLSEGMATFLADAFLEQRFGRARYDRELAQSRQIYEGLKADGKDRALSYSDWTTPQQAGGKLPYDKGALALAELRRQLGDEIFWRGLRVYTSGHWGSAVTSSDLQAAMQSAARKDLTKFFQAWVY